MYRVENTHEGIVTKEIYEAVQDGMKSRKEEGALNKYRMDLLGEG